MNRNFISSERRAISVTNQKPRPYSTIWDDHPEYVQVQRTQATITGHTVKWDTNNIDPNMFLSSKAYIKLEVDIRKRETELDSKSQFVAERDGDYVLEDRIYKKPGMVLHNACTIAKVRMNNHEMEYKDLRYIQKKLNMSFAGKKINNTYLSTSGGDYEEYDGVYNSQGNVDDLEETMVELQLVRDIGFAATNNWRFISDRDVLIGSELVGLDVAGGNTWAFDGSIGIGTNTITFAIGAGVAVDLLNPPIGTRRIEAGMTIVFGSGIHRTFVVETVTSSTTILVNPRIGIPAAATGGDVLVTDKYTTDREVARLQFGDTPIAVNLGITQIFKIDDIITFTTGQTFRVIGFSGNDELIVGNINNISDTTPLAIVAITDVLTRVVTQHTADSGRQQSYDSASLDMNIDDPNGLTTIVRFKYVEPISFGPFNPFSDYGSPLANSKNGNKLSSGCWYNRTSDLIPYIRQLGITMTFKDIAANSLIYPYGRITIPPAASGSSSCKLVDLNIVSAELVLFWVKPRKEKIFNLPTTIRIQSWQYDHREFPLPAADEDVALINQETSTTIQENIVTSQQPTFILYYGMVGKDTDDYICRAINNTTNKNGDFQTISMDENSVEAGMHPIDTPGEVPLIIRSNTLGGDDIISSDYNAKELYRITLKNSSHDFPYNYTKFRGLAFDETTYAEYPSEFYFLIGEGDLNTFFVRKGQLQQSVVMNYTSSLVATDGISIHKNAQGTAFRGGIKEYKLHLFYIYDRYYIELTKQGNVTSGLDANFY